MSNMNAGNGTLSFVTMGAGRSNYWNVSRTDDWERDVVTGKLMAHEVTNYLVGDGSPMVIRRIFRDMDASGELCGVGVGFITGIAAAMVAASSDEQTDQLVPERHQ